VQSTIGLATGAAVYGVALGGRFALVFAGAYGRISKAGPLRVGLVTRLGGDVSMLRGVGTFVVVVVIAALVMPGVSEVPATFPAQTLWSFRLASIGVALVMWTTIGLVFAAAAARAIERPHRARVAARAA
jgi:hypothetical protein